MSENTEGTPVSSTPWLDPANEIEMTEEPRPSGLPGLRTFSPKGIGERPSLSKAKATDKAPAKTTAKKAPAKKKGN